MNNFATWFTLATTFLVIVFDVWLVRNRYRSISKEFFRRLGMKIPLIPYMWGALAGHYWGPPRRPPLTQDFSMYIMIGVGVAVSVPYFFLQKRFGLPVWVGLIWFAVGIPMGVFLFPHEGV